LEQNTNEYLIGTSSQLSNGTYIILVGPVYKDVELLVRCVIGGDLTKQYFSIQYSHIGWTCFYYKWFVIFLLYLEVGYIYNNWRSSLNFKISQINISLFSIWKRTYIFRKKVFVRFRSYIFGWNLFRSKHTGERDYMTFTVESHRDFRLIWPARWIKLSSLGQAMCLFFF
jgi:hypothetical protein